MLMALILPSREIHFVSRGIIWSRLPYASNLLRYYNQRANASQSLPIFAFAATAAHVNGSVAITTGTRPRSLLVKDFYVSPDESGMRLDRFLKHRLGQESEFATVNNSLVNKWLRKRQIKLLRSQGAGPQDKRAQDGVEDTNTTAGAVTMITGTTRTQAGQTWRVRALWEHTEPPSVGIISRSAAPDSSRGGAVDQMKGRRRVELPLQDWVVYKDERIVVLDKPAGIVVQGGTGIESSIDGSLSILQDDYPEKPRIVHRLDGTTSGLLILARTRKAAQDLTGRFHESTTGTASTCDTNMTSNRIQKKYLAIVGSKGPLLDPESQIELKAEGALTTLRGSMIAVTQGKRQSIQMLQREPTEHRRDSAMNTTWASTTDIRIVSQSHQKDMHWALLHLYPRTGRKHQLRVHCAQLLNAPILGDSKYLAEGDSQDRKKGPIRIYLHMAELILKDWFKNGPEEVSRVTEDEKRYKVLDDGSLVLRAEIPDDMRRQLRVLGLIGVQV
ncbi:pseudouridine synthase [Gamsiella multidivaricata]|uniref:pseudouridine synthase n=1 Tax=Gamsiella multidivaricata TaxID=101098 RepID=UPI002220F9C4|nr:pseudouridine synthase [Gamsiella multidivaricata]KAI7816782.1 pseudouridine synthase [Gamsiella multidivaricata]